MGYLYRCKKIIKKGQSKGKLCDTRRMLRKRLAAYARPPKCKCCGAELHYLDKWQMKRNKKTTCRCDGAHYPHRTGSVPLCRFWVGEEPERPTSRYVLPDGSVMNVY